MSTTPYVYKKDLVDMAVKLDPSKSAYKYKKMTHGDLSNLVSSMKKKINDPYSLGDMSSDAESDDEADEIQSENAVIPEVISTPIISQPKKSVPKKSKKQLKSIPVTKTVRVREEPSTEQKIRSILKELKKDVTEIIKPIKSKARSHGLNDSEVDILLDEYNAVLASSKAEVNLILDDNDISDSLFKFLETTLQNIDDIVESIIN
jgi:arsenate reductase-like glutaredoxin family protein